MIQPRTWCPFLVALLLAALACSANAQVAAPPVTGRGGMAASAEPHATEAGLAVLRAGGNAVDAAVAMGFVLAVTHPAAGNIGGGGFMVIHLPGKGETTLDYREMAPGRATRDMYLDAESRPVEERSTIGHLAVAVPGSVAGLCHALATFGTRPLPEIMAPAIRLAREGFAVSHHLARSLEAERKLLRRFPESKRIFLGGGSLLAPGDRFEQPDLAATLERIAAAGPKGFYEGPTAEMLLAEMNRGGGIITEEDLRGYRVVERVPVRGTYRGFEIVSMPPPSSGGVCLIEMLNILERFDLGASGHNASATLHLMAEAMRQAFADRAEYMGDPDHADVPARGLLSKRYATLVAAGIRPGVARTSETVGRGDPWPFEKESTTHYSVVDGAGGAVACTTTLNGSYGSGVTVAGAGFLLNNEMDDLAAAPGRPNMYGLIQGERNAVAPRRRPLSSMTPTLIMKNGEVLVVAGTPGGPTIINTVLQIVINVIDFRMNAAEAVFAPRIHHQWLPDRIVHERWGFPEDVTAALRRMGHVLDTRARMGDAHVIARDPETGILSGASDPRGGGRAAGF